MSTSALTQARFDHSVVDSLLDQSDQQRATLVPLLETRNLSKSYADHRIFADVSFTLNTGTTSAIIGPNGAGKSTLLRCCVRLVEPDSGSVLIANQEVMGLPHKKLLKARAKVGFVFQKHQLIGRMSVLSNVIHGSLGQHSGPQYWTHRFAKEAVRERAYQCLAQVGLQDLALRRADQLSGGQSQRVAIARVLMQDCEMIFADEPTASLDPKSGCEVLELLQQLCQEKDLAVLMVSHDMEQTQQFCDRILGLKDAGLQLNAASDDYTLPELKRFFGM